MTNSNNFKRSDDSNPQQGSSATLSTAAAAATTSSTLSQSSSSSKTETNNNTAATFKIPPTKKDNRKLFVGGLPPEVTDAEFKAFFEQHGTIIDSIVMIDRDTKCSRGFGFVTFEDPAIANRLIVDNVQEDSKSKVNIAGKWCEVKASEPKRYLYGKHNNNHSGEGGGGGGRGRSMASTPATSEMSSRNSSIETFSRNTSANTKKGGVESSKGGGGGGGGGTSGTSTTTKQTKPDENEKFEGVLPVQQVGHINNHNNDYNYQYNQNYPPYYNHHQTPMPYQQVMGYNHHHNMPYYHHPAQGTARAPMNMNTMNTMTHHMPPYMYQYPQQVSQVPPMMGYNSNYDFNGGGGNGVGAPPQQQYYGNHDYAYHQYHMSTIAPQISYDGHDPYAAAAVEGGEATQTLDRNDDNKQNQQTSNGKE